MQYCRYLLRSIVVSATLLLLSASALLADNFITGSGTGGITLNQSINGFDNVIGWRITVGSTPLLVTALGAWDSGNDGLQSDMRVGLWQTSSATLLGDVIVPAGAGASFSDGFRFASLSAPLILLPNTSYTFGERLVGPIGTQNQLRGASLIPFANGAGFFTSYAMNNGGGGESTSTNFATEMPFQDLGDGTPLLGPNFQFTTIAGPAASVPEGGSSALLLAVGLASLAVARRGIFRRKWVLA